MISSVKPTASNAVLLILSIPNLEAVIYGWPNVIKGLLQWTAQSCTAIVYNGAAGAPPKHQPQLGYLPAKVGCTGPSHGEFGAGRSTLRGQAEGWRCWIWQQICTSHPTCSTHFDSSDIFQLHSCESRKTHRQSDGPQRGK